MRNPGFVTVARREVRWTSGELRESEKGVRRNAADGAEIFGQRGRYWAHFLSGFLVCLYRGFSAVLR